ncbi:MAG: MATE family efflux transporter [Clostridia bacterium]|nr:MATE family efflux transporter [Clostridia bacterium]
MTEGPLLGKMIVFTLPVMASGLLQLLFNAADVMVVGKFAGDAAMAAVGCCGALINLIINLFIGLAVGAGVMAAQDIGAKRYEGVKKLVSTALTASIVGGIFVGILGFVLAEPLLILMDTPDDVLVEAVPYMRAYFCGIPGCLIYNYMAAILRSTGDTKRPLYFLTAAGVANVGMNLLMVCVFHLGAIGVGIATAVAQYVSATLILIYMARMEGYCRITGFAVDKSKLLRMITIGLPAGLQGCMFSLSNVLIQSNVNTYPTPVIAGNTAAGNLEGFVYTSMNSVYQTALTFIGQNVGAGKYERIKKISGLCVGMVTVIGLTLGVGLAVFGDKLLLLYASGENIDAVIAAGVNRLSIISATYVLCGLMDVGCGILRGMGKAIQPMIVSLLGSCAFRIVWVNTICQWFPGQITILYISYPISWILTASVHYLFCFYFYRLLMKRKKMAELQPQNA